MRIGIVGSGKLGTMIAEKFQKEGHHVVVTTMERSKKCYEMLHKNISVMVYKGGDTRQTEIFLDLNFDFLVICVAPRVSGLDKYFDTYVVTAKSFAELREKCPRGVYISSTGALKDNPKGKILKEAESYIEKLKDFSILRPSALIQPGQENLLGLVPCTFYSAVVKEVYECFTSK